MGARRKLAQGKRAVLFQLVVNGVETHHSLEKDMEFWVRLRVDQHLEERFKQVSHNIVEGSNGVALFVHIVEPRNLDEPPDIMAKKLVIDNPRR